MGYKEFQKKIFEKMIITSKNSILHKRIYQLIVQPSKRTPEECRKRRHKSSRKKINGTNERPRLVVHRSNNHIYAQVIDDSRMSTLAAASSGSPLLREFVTRNNIPTAQIVGKEIARLCIEKGIKKVVFDRAGYLYHGRVKALADSARASGLLF